jgi:hypothetical protein
MVVLALCFDFRYFFKINYYHYHYYYHYYCYYSRKAANDNNSFYRITDGRDTGIMYENDFPPIAKLDMYPNTRYISVYIRFHISQVV